MRFRSGCDIVKGDKRGPAVHAQSVHFKGKAPSNVGGTVGS